MKIGAMKNNDWEIFEPLLREAFERTGTFTAEGVDTLLNRISERFVSASDLTCFSVFGEGRQLSSLEKKALGLNSRRQYTAEFIACCDQTRLHETCPRRSYEAAYQGVVRRVNGIIKLAAFHNAGIQEVEIIDASGNACEELERLGKVHPIDSAPALPLSSCSTPAACRCMYVAKVAF